MKKALIFFASFAFLGKAQSQTRSYQQVDVVKVSGVTSSTLFNALSQADKQTSRTYFDGLGRPIQSVGVQASPQQKDLVQPIQYNNLGQQDKSYLPYAATTTDGSYHSSQITEQSTFYQTTGQKIATDNNPYSQQVFENSPLARVLRAGLVGNGFQPVSGQHYKSVSYRSNTSGDGVRQWDYDNATSSSAYANNSLSVTDAVDEQGAETLVFTDNAGRTILKRQMKGSETFDTYYVYNPAGRLGYVVPPKAVGIMQGASNYSLTQTGVNKLVFKYLYDGYGRVVEKTVPGSGDIYAVYDTLGRVVLLQDPNLRAANKWNYIKYDHQGRAISQGIHTDATYTTRVTMQDNVKSQSYNTNWAEQRNNASSTGYYTNVCFPTANIEPLAYSYFDDYDLDGNGSADYTYQSQGLPGEGIATTNTVGLPTMLRKRSIGTGLSNIWLINISYYDEKLRPIQTRSNNQLNSTIADVSTRVSNFTGVATVTKVVKVTSATTSVRTDVTYDPMFRVLALDQSYNGGTAIRVASYNYNAIGQLVEKNLHSSIGGSLPADVTLGTAQSITSGNSLSVTATNSITISPDFTADLGSTLSLEIAAFLQSVDYRYSIRGQLLSINNSTLTSEGTKNDDDNDVFGLELSYDEAVSGLGNAAIYNGQVSAVRWMSRDASGTKGTERSYKYSYDQLNRFTDALYQDKVSGSWNSSGAFDEKEVTYDKNGNITALKRNAVLSGSPVAIDNLSYTYDSNNPNRLATVSDGTGSNYTAYGFRNLTGTTTGSNSYDNNGNLTADPFKGLTLTYNTLNRADQITVTTATGRYITYTYDAAGNLLRKQQYDASTLQKTTDYIGGFVYENSTLAYFATPEGRVRNAGGTLKSEYTIADQQGNARVSFEDNSGTARVIQENSYYAFGLVMPGSAVTTPTTPNKNLYNGGSEWQNDFSNLPDYYQTFFRNYDAALGRWTGVDPDPESAESLSTYHYSGNNPVTFNDPLGDKKKEVEDPPPVYPYYWSAYSSDGWGGGGIGASFNGGVGRGGRAGGGGGFYEQSLQWGATAASGLLNAARNGDPAAIAEYNLMIGAKPITDIDNYISYIDGGLEYRRADHASVTEANGNTPGNMRSVWYAFFDVGKLSANVNQRGADARSNVGNALVFGGVAYGGMANAVANKYWWLSAKGEYLSTKILQVGENGKFIRGVQGYRNGYQSALRAAKGYSVAGNIVGGLGIAVTGLQYLNGDITGTEAAFDTAFGVIGFFGPIGAGVSATYFLGKMGYEYFSGDTLFDKPR